MVRAAALVAGDGAMLQGILDSIYFKEFPDFKLEAVICPRKEDYAMVRAIRADVPSFVVDPDLSQRLSVTAWPLPTSSRTWISSW